MEEKPKENSNDDRKVVWGHESRGCHKIQLLSSLVTFRTSYKITLSWSHTESLKLFFVVVNGKEMSGQYNIQHEGKNASFKV